MLGGTAYCPACGVDSRVIYLTSGSGVAAEEQARCASCGFWFQAEASGAAGTLFARVGIAEDSDPIRKAVKEDLILEGLAGAVDDFADGAAMVAALKNAVPTGRLYDLAILDLNMPGFDGLKVAGFLRTFEQQLKTNPAPVLFFSSVVCDDRLRQTLTRLTPAFYLNKGTVKSRTELPARLNAVLKQIRSSHL